jgi:hypothetical protein
MITITTNECDEKTELTEEQFQNLAHLTEYVREHATDEVFCMSTYSSVESDGESWMPNPEHCVDVCGTAACFAGHGPASGLLGDPEELWPDYVERVFGVSAGDLLYDFLFGAWWPNSIEEAVKRADYVLTHRHVPISRAWEEDWGGPRP